VAFFCKFAGPTSESTEHYRTVTYWYGLPAATLVRMDELRIGDDASESQHEYRSPDASKARTIKSRYELGPDISAEESERAVRYTTGESQFMLKLCPDNHGMLLRRTLGIDYAVYCWVTPAFEVK
jgi:hypothetical protein